MEVHKFALGSAALEEAVILWEHALMRDHFALCLGTRARAGAGAGTGARAVVPSIVDEGGVVVLGRGAP